MARNKKLRTLVLEGDRNYEEMNDIIPIHWQSYHIIEIFMHYLPKIELNGSSKLTIYFKKKPVSESQYMYDDYFGVSWYYVEEIYINGLKSLKKENVNEYYLNLIVSILKYIAQINNKGKEIIEQVANKVRESNFELILLQKKVSKLSSDKQYKANVYRNINHLGEIWYVEIKNRNKKSITRYEIMDNYTHVSKIEVYKKSYWKDKKFILTDRFDREMAIVEIKEI